MPRSTNENILSVDSILESGLRSYDSLTTRDSAWNTLRWTCYILYRIAQSLEFTSTP